MLKKALVLLAVKLILILNFCDLQGQSQDTTVLLKQAIVQFDTDRSIIPPVFKEEIRVIIDSSKSCQNAFALIEAHTDNIGQDDYNLKLSEERAMSIRGYLKEIGFEHEIETDYFGEQIQIDDNQTAEGRAMNRRAILKVYCTQQMEVSQHEKQVEKELLVRVKGKVVNSKNEGLKALIQIKGKEYANEIESNSEGHFTIMVPANKVLKFIGLSEGYEPAVKMAKTNAEMIAERLILKTRKAKWVKPDKVKVLVHVIDAINRKNIEATLYIIRGNQVDTVMTEDDGLYELNISTSGSTAITASAKDYFYTSKVIDSPEGHQIDVEMELRKLGVGENLTADNIFFYGNRAEVLPSSLPNLALLAEKISESKNLCFLIKGHVNVPFQGRITRTNPSFILSKNRAQTVFQYLINKGIPPEKLKYDGRGNWEMKFPKAQIYSEMQQNMRVEIEVNQCL